MGLSLRTLFGLPGYDALSVHPSACAEKVDDRHHSSGKRGSATHHHDVELLGVLALIAVDGFKVSDGLPVTDHERG